MTKPSLPATAPTTGQLLASFPRIFGGETVSLRQILDVLGDRGLALVLLLVTIPQFLPLPLVLSNLLALPIVLVAGQIALGRHSLWLPAWLMQRPIRRRRLLQATDRAVPVLARIERFVRPRLEWVWSPAGGRIVGVVCFLISCVLLMPVPLTGWLPTLSLAMIALGLLERDGLVVLIGSLLGLVAGGILVSVLLGFDRLMDRIAAAGGMAWQAAVI